MPADRGKFNLKRLTPISKGEDVTAVFLNQSINALNKLGASGPSSQNISPSQNNFTVRQFRVKIEKGDYLECVTWDGKKEGENTVLIAKPYLLRLTPFDSLTNPEYETRVLTEELELKYEYYADNIGKRKAVDTLDDDNTEDQTIVPIYNEDKDVIFACYGVFGGVGVTEEDNEENILQWMDMNFDGRYWARDANPPEEEE
jgi:hypothetical protein